MATTGQGSRRRAEALRKRRARRRRQAILLRFVVVSMAVLIVTGAIYMIVRLLGSEEQAAQEAVFCEGISFEGKPLTGLTMEEGRTQVMAQLEALNWNMQVRCGEDRVPVDDLFTGGVDELLNQAFAYGHTGSQEEQESQAELLKEEPVEYTVLDLYSREQAERFAESFAEAKNTATTAAVLSGYDAETGELLFSDPTPGQVLDQADLVLRIEEEVENRNFQAVIDPVFDDEYTQEEMPAEYSADAVRASYQKIGSFTTETTPGNEARDVNITLACQAVSGTVVQPGATFSILEAIGGTTAEQGYQEAGTYVGGEVVNELGGGICQVSSTLYNAVIVSGLNTTERHNHSMSVSYVPAGEDAMISYPNSDFKFENNSGGTVLITMGFHNNVVWADLYGIPILGEGESIRMESEVKEVLPAPEPQYVDDLSLVPGAEEVASAPKEGSKVVTYLIREVNGTEVSREFLHNSVYNPKAAVVRRNPNPPEASSENHEKPEGSGETSPGGDLAESGADGTVLNTEETAAEGTAVQN